MAVYANRWRKLEKRYSVNNYDGSGPRIFVIKGNTHPQLVLSAPHATNHSRDGFLKYADRGTGGLVELVASELGASAVTVAAGRHGDANHDRAHPLKDAILSLHPSFVLDVNGMKDRPGVATVDLGVGRGLTHLGVVTTLKNLLSTSDGVLFTGGKKPATVTAWAQLRGIPALQIEITASFRPPLGSDKHLNQLVSALLKALTYHEF